MKYQIKWHRFHNGELYTGPSCLHEISDINEAFIYLEMETYNTDRIRLGDAICQCEFKVEEMIDE